MMIPPCFLALLIRPESHLLSSSVHFDAAVPAQLLIKGIESQHCGEIDHRKHIPWFHVSVSLLLFLPFTDSFLLPSTDMMRCAAADVLRLLVSLGNISISSKATQHRRAEVTRGPTNSCRAW